MVKKLSIFSKIIEMILLIVSTAVTALPMLYCVFMIGDTIKFDFPEHGVRGVFLISVYLAAILGFFFQIIRAIAIWTSSTSKVITTGLIMGLCVYLFFIIPVMPTLRHVGWLLMIAYSTPALAISLSLRNIYLHRKSIKSQTEFQRQ